MELASGVANATFERAVSSAKSLPASTTDEQKLKLYGLYKQATVGPAPAEGPSRLNVVAFSKWSAWNDVRTLSAEQASGMYVTLVASLSQPTPLPDDEYTKLSRMFQTTLKEGAFDENPPERSEPPTLSSSGQPLPFGSLRLSRSDWTLLYGLHCCAVNGPCTRGFGCCASAVARKRHAAWSAAGKLDRYEARRQFTAVANRILDEVYPRPPVFQVKRIFSVCFADRNAAK